MSDRPSAGRVTRDVEPTAVPDLLDDPPRAALVFVDADEVEVLPVRARHRNGVHLAGVGAGAPDLTGREVVLVRDDGPYWFQLRAVTVRGIAGQTAAPDDGNGRAVVWYVIEPRRVVAWDYATLRDS